MKDLELLEIAYNDLEAGMQAATVQTGENMIAYQDTEP